MVDQVQAQTMKPLPSEPRFTDSTTIVSKSEKIQATPASVHQRLIANGFRNVCRSSRCVDMLESDVAGDASVASTSGVSSFTSMNCITMMDLSTNPSDFAEGQTKVTAPLTTDEKLILMMRPDMNDSTASGFDYFQYDDDHIAEAVATEAVRALRSTRASRSRNDCTEITHRFSLSRHGSIDSTLDRKASAVAESRSPDLINGADHESDDPAVKVANIFHEILAHDSEFPTFEPEELALGKFLGSGGFSNVTEISRIQLASPDFKLRRTNSVAQDNRESRIFMAEHCLRPGGEARYAIKRLKEEYVSDASTCSVEERNVILGIALEDLINEVRILSKLEHPHIIKLRGMASAAEATTGDAFFLVLDRLYETLKQRMCNSWLAKRKQAAKWWTDPRGFFRHDFLEERLKIAYDLSTAIHYLHNDKGVLHRDVKPENIGFDIRGDIKIFDFGFARKLPSGHHQSNECYNFSRMTGSLRYMAPEVALGQPYNQGCDVYSFAVMLWEMLALERAYGTTKSEAAFIEKVCRSGYRPPLRKVGTNNKEVRRILKGAWHADVKKRLSIEEVMLDLRDFLVVLRGGDETGLDHRSSSKKRRSTYVYKKKSSASSRSLSSSGRPVGFKSNSNRSLRSNDTPVGSPC